VLTQPTKRVELHETGVERAAVYLFLVSWAREMAVEVGERPERVVAEHTLVRIAVPRLLCGDVPGFVTVGKEFARNGDRVVAVVDLDPSVDHPASSTRWASPVFEVCYHGRLVDKELCATIVLECTG